MSRKTRQYLASNKELMKDLRKALGELAPVQIYNQFRFKE